MLRRLDSLVLSFFAGVFFFFLDKRFLNVFLSEHTLFSSIISLNIKVISS